MAFDSVLHVGKLLLGFASLVSSTFSSLLIVFRVIDYEY